MKTRWIAIDGKASIQDSNIVFVGEAGKKGKASANYGQEKPYSLVRSNIFFESGDIHADVLLEKKDTKLQFRFKSQSNTRIYIGMNTQNAAYGIAKRDITGFSALSIASTDERPAENEPMHLHIKVRGSAVELLIDGVCVASAQLNLLQEQVELVFNGYGKVEVKNITIRTIKPQVFVVMQFTDAYDALYKEVISPVCESYGYDVIRADDIYTTGLIIDDVTSSIRESSLVIADITPNNLNVFYEVGYAHGIGKATIMLSDRNREKLPFDISGYRLLFYDNTIGGKSAVENALRKHLDAIRF